MAARFIPVDLKAWCFHLLLLLTEINLATSENAIFCLPLRASSSLNCEDSVVSVTQAYLGNTADRHPKFCENPFKIPEYRQFALVETTDIVRHYCNTFQNCQLNSQERISQLNATYIYIEFQCIQRPTSDNAYMNFFADLEGYGNEVILQTSGYPSSYVETHDIACKVENSEGIPSIRLEIYDFRTNESGDDNTLCMEWEDKQKTVCAEKGGITKTVIFEPGPFMIRKRIEKPLFARFYTTMIAISTPDGFGPRSPTPFNLTCRKLKDGELPPFTPGISKKHSSSNGQLPIIIGAILGGIAVIALAVVLVVVYLWRKRKGDPLKRYSSVFQYNVNTARRLGALDTQKDPGEAIYDELDDVRNVYSNDSRADYRVSHIAPYETSQHGRLREPINVVTNKGIFVVSDGKDSDLIDLKNAVNSSLNGPNKLDAIYINNGQNGGPRVIPPYSIVNKKQPTQDVSALYSLPDKSGSPPKQKPPIAAKPKTPNLPKRDTRLTEYSVGSKRESDASYSLEIVDNSIYKY